MATQGGFRALWSLTLCFLLTCLILSFSGGLCFMDMEELKTVYYGLDILKEPVPITKEVPAGAVHVTSKYGQQYQCTFPDHSSEEKRKEEEEKLAMETGIVEMLKPMGNSPCLFKAKDWWSYEFCYGKHIRQFHMEDGDIKGNIIYLGYYQEDFNWDNETAREDRLKSKTGQSRYHSQKYTLGTRCDLTGQMRRAEVRFVCEENSEDYLSRVDESETCVYTVTVVTSRICRHPYLKAPIRRKPVPITCNPLLTEEQFQSYTQEVKEAKQKEMQMEIAQEEQLNLNKILSDELSKSAKELLTKPLDELFPKSGEETSMGKAVFEKIFGQDETLWKSYMQHVESQKGDRAFNVKKLKKLFEDFKKAESREESSEKVEKTAVDKKSDEHEANKAEKNDEVEEILSDFNNEIKELRERFGNSQSSISKIKKKLTLDKNLEAEVEDAIQQAEREMGVKVDRNLISGLSSTLDKLVDKLQDTEAELASAGKELGKLKPGKPIITNKGEASAAVESNSDEDEDKDDEEEEEEEEEEDKGSGTKNQQELSDMKIQAPPRTSTDPVVPGPADPVLRPPTMEEEQEGLVGSDARRENQGQSNDGTLLRDQGVASPDQQRGDGGANAVSPGQGIAAAAAEGEDDDDDKDEDVAELTVTLRKVDNTKPELPDNVQKLLEDSIKKEYKRNKLDGDSQPLSFDTDHSIQRDRTVHVIQSEDDEGKTNRYIFVFGFNNFNDESAERQRQSSMEENYGFVYSRNKDKKSIPPSGS